ncbi:MAG: hypothetical protein N2689_01515 [Verrucomicrobiae bacterium]|nr:hypothetical protein [Verrucomicrobiae bacterium]
MPNCAANAIVVIAIVMVLWTVVAGVLGLKLWKVVERMNAKIDQIAGDVRSLSQKGELLLAELQGISTKARAQVETVGTIVRDVRGWVDKVETTANALSALARHSVTTSLSNLKAFFAGMMGFLQFFTRPSAARPGAPETDVSKGKED